jgi:hypothetical protein
LALLSTIVMPLSADLVDQNSVDWQDTTLGLGAWAYDQAATALRGSDVDKATGDISKLSDAIARTSAASGLGVAGVVTNTSATLTGPLGIGWGL